MRKEKAKNDSFWQAAALPFIALWAGTYAAAWLAMLAFYDSIVRLLGLSGSESTFVGVAAVTMIPALLQVPLVEQLLKYRMRGWIPMAILGSLITSFTFTNFSTEDSRFVLSVMSLFVPIALLQTAWLWRHVKAAWLWVLTSVVASIVFTLPMRDGMRNGEMQPIVLVFAGLLYGIVQGVIMRYLWMQPREAEKAKHENVHAEDNTLAEQRAQRLQQADDSAVPWLYSEDQIRQGKVQ